MRGTVAKRIRKEVYEKGEQKEARRYRIIRVIKQFLLPGKTDGDGNEIKIDINKDTWYSVGKRALYKLAKKIFYQERRAHGK